MSTAARDARYSRSPTSSLSGIELFTNAVWYRSQAVFKGMLAPTDSDISTDSCQPRQFPPEIVEAIIAHLKHDTPALKACAATCFSWYNIATPHLHHTLTLWQWATDISHRYLEPLTSLGKLGLLPYVKVVRIKVFLQVLPAIFNSQGMRYFGALVNLQGLTMSCFDFSKFPAGLGEYFGQFSPTLRSVALSDPNGTRRQLLDFLMLFPKLDDIKISNYYARDEAHEALDSRLIPITAGLRGQLFLMNFREEGLLKDIIVAFGGMRFTTMDLRSVRGVQLLLDSCADTLETLRIYPENISQHLLSQHFSVSHNTTLRSLEVLLRSAINPLPQDTAGIIKELLSTITSPTFSEIVVVFSGEKVDQPSQEFVQVLREMYEIKEFKVAFCLETSEELRVQNLRHLALETRAAIAAGTYGFLPCPPLVFSRSVTKYDIYMDPIGGVYI